MPLIEFKGTKMKRYLGKDGVRPLTMFPGMRAEVSEEKAAQILEDYPAEFELMGASKAKEPKETQAPKEKEQVKKKGKK